MVVLAVEQLQQIGKLEREVESAARRAAAGAAEARRRTRPTEQAVGSAKAALEAEVLGTPLVIVVTPSSRSAFRPRLSKASVRAKCVPRMRSFSRTHA